MESKTSRWPRNYFYISIIFAICILGLFCTSCIKKDADPSSNPIRVPTVHTDNEGVTMTPYDQAFELYLDGDLNKSKQMLDREIALNRGSAEIYNLRGMIYQKNLEYSQAIEDFSAALALDPTNVEYLTNRGVSWQYLDNSTEAAQDFNAAIQVDPNYVDALFNLGILYFNDEKYTLAEEHLRKAAASSEDEDTWYYLGAVYDFNNKPEDAIAALTKAIEFQSGFEEQPFHLRGIVYLEKGNNEQAEADFTRVIESGYWIPNVFFNRGLARYRMNKWNLALEDFTEAIRLDPRDENAYYYRAYTYAQLGNQKSARKDAQKAIELDDTLKIDVSKQ